jgi:uncharacterized repeat protein (TIGR01451 family)/gliding motility-associated-like protein
MKKLILTRNHSLNVFFYLRKLAPLFVLFLVHSAVHAQVVVVNETENIVAMEQVSYLIDGQELVQNSPDGNQNPSPEDASVVVSGIRVAGGRVIFATTRRPTVANPNPAIGSNEIRPNAIQIVRSNDLIISHRDPAFFENLEEVVSTPDIRSYWDINSQPSIPRGEPFVDLIYSDPVVTSGYLLYTERDGNSATDFIALGRDGEPIEGANVIQVRGFQWKTGINHISNEPTQSQEMVLFSPALFASEEPIFGIRIVAVNEPDGKLVFFVNAITATPDMAERVNSELGGEAVLNIFDNDELNGAPLNPIDIQLTILQDFPEGSAVLNSDGTVDVPANTAPGIYTLRYQITAGEEADEAEVRIEVIEYKPEAFDDSVEAADSFARDSVLNVLENDLLNGLPALIENINLTTVSNNSGGFIRLTADGSIDIDEGVPSGDYLLVYQICDASDPVKCDQATATIRIAPTVLTAANDDYGSVNLNRAGPIGNVLENDLLNGAAIPDGRVQVSLLDADGLSGLTLSTDGELSLPAGLPNGSYELSYEIAELINPGNTDQGLIRFTLLDIQLEANDDAFTTNQNQGLILDVLANDFINTGELLVETLQIIEGPQNGSLIQNPDGTLSYSPDPNFSGTDSFTYEICENTDRQFCDQALVSLTVRPILLEASKVPNLSVLPIGGLVSYTLTLTNNSDFALEDVQVEDILPEGLMLLSSEPEAQQGTTWLIETIPSGTVVEIDMLLMAVGLGPQVNTATIAIGEYSDGVQAVPVTVVARPVNVGVEKTSFGVALYEGNEFAYEIRVTNSGDSPAENITLTDELPTGLVYLGFTGDAEVSVSGNTVTWTIPSLAAGGSQVYTIQVQARQVGSITNTVRVQVPEDQENTSTQPEDSDTNQVNPFFIPNVITPGNADGKNDTFEIRGIDRFAQSSLTILNRNGDHVFVSEDYQNDWEAQGLNAGSYFYVLVITDRAGESQTYKGWLQVVK